MVSPGWCNYCPAAIYSTVLVRVPTGVGGGGLLMMGVVLVVLYIGVVVVVMVECRC